MSNSLQPHGLQNARLPSPSSMLGACSNSCPSSQWCHPTISSSVVPFSRFQSFPASGSFLMSQFFGFSFFLGLNICKFRINLITGFGANYLWPRLSCWISPLQGSNWMACSKDILEEINDCSVWSTITINTIRWDDPLPHLTWPNNHTFSEHGNK